MNADLALLVLRVVVGVVIMGHGLLKLGWVGKGGSISGVAGWFNGLGLRPGMFWAWVAVLAEAGGGLLTILGLGGFIGPGVVAADLVVVTVIAHLPKGFWAAEGGWEFPVPVAAGAFAVALIGNGRWSLDAILGLGYSDQLALAWAALLIVGVALAIILHTAFRPKPKPA
jgi:putative oxidoreductase